MLTPGFQPEMVPSSVAKMNTDGRPPGMPLSNKKSVRLPLNTTPVGVDCVPAGAKPGGGTTTKFPATPPASVKILTGFPAPLKRLEVPELLLPIHQGLPEERVSPQGFLRLGSTRTAVPSALFG